MKVEQSSLPDDALEDHVVELVVGGRGAVERQDEGPAEQGPKY